jgi:hypothetical protein
MADISITAASVVAGSNSVQDRGVLGETVTAGQVVYKSSTDSKWYKADANAASAEQRIAIGIALNGGAVNQPVAVHKAGLITIGATLTAGTAYYLSDTPGGICPLADVGSGEYVVLIGLATTTAIINVAIQYPGVAL